MIVPNSHQPHAGNAQVRLNERKIVKTISLKKVSAVAVASLGFGLLSVVPANAGTQTTTPSEITITTPSVTAIVGSAVSTTFAFKSTAALAATNTLGVISSITKPTDSAVTVADGDAVTGSAQATVNNTGKAATLTSTGYSSPLTTITSAGDITTSTSTVAGTITFKPDVPGTYVYTLSGASAANDANATSVKATFTVVARSLAYTTGESAAATPFDTGTAIAGPANTVTVTGTSTGATGVRSLVTVEGAGATIASATAGSGTSVIAADFKSARIPAATNAPVVINTPTAGTITVKLYNETGNATGIFSATAANTVTITVAAAAVVGVYAASKVYMNTSTTTPDLTSDATTTTTAPSASSTASNTPLANIIVKQQDAQATATNVATADTKAIVYEIAGAGALGTSSGQRLGSYIAVAAASANDNIVYIFPDGRSGTGTVTVKVNGVLVSTKTVKFYGSAAAYAATVVNKHVASSGAATTGAITVKVTDANAVAVPSATVYASVGTSDKASITASAVTNSSGVASFDVTGVSTKFGAVTVTFSNASTTAATTISTTASIGVSSTKAKTVTVAFNKATYAPGEKITLTLTALDSNGLGIADRTYAADELLKNLATNPAMTSGIGTTPFLGTAGVEIVAGVATATAYAPLTGGPVSISWTLRGTAGDTSDSTYLVAALQGATVSASASVTDANAALLTQIDALNAKIVALNALIAKIMKKLGVK
jgi:hypothetical protein